MINSANLIIYKILNCKKKKIKAKSAQDSRHKRSAVQTTLCFTIKAFTVYDGSYSSHSQSFSWKPTVC